MFGEHDEFELKSHGDVQVGHSIKGIQQATLARKYGNKFGDIASGDGRLGEPGVRQQENGPISCCVLP